MVLAFFLVSWPIDYFRKKMRIIDINSQDIQQVKKDLNIVEDKLNFKSDVENLNIRLSVMENLFNPKNKKGQIDPRWVIIIMILVVFFLYLRVKGII